MRILVVNNMAPFIWGGAEELAVHLARQLRLAGHESEVFRLPFQWEPSERIPSQMLLARMIELRNVDRVIALKFPAYLVRHEHKTLWLLHQYRQAYDLFDAGASNLADGPHGLDLRSMIVEADRQAFSEARNIYVNSPVTQSRLRRYNDVPSTVLHPPVNDAELFQGGEVGDYIFVGGRVNGMKRQCLVIEALAHADRRAKLLVAGPPDTPEDEVAVRETVARLGLEDRVRLDLRMVPRASYAEYLNASAAVAYLPFDEDSLGYVAMEAAMAGKALISTTDAGGILGLARDGVSGWVTTPDARALAPALSSACGDRDVAMQRGDMARQIWADLGITWPDTIEALLR